MFKWFKKRIKTVPNPSSIAPLYTATTNQISATINAVNSLEPQIQDLQNRLDQLPPIPDLSQYARKDQINVFTQHQEIQDSAPNIFFKKTNGQRKGYLGVPSYNSDDVELKAETNTLKLGANHNVDLTCGSNYNVRVNKDPTTANGVATKRYVDTQIANIPTSPPVDLTNYARTDQSNTFTSNQNIQGVLNVSNGGIVTPRVNAVDMVVERVDTSDNKAVVNREFLRNNYNNRAKWFIEHTERLKGTIWKRDVSSGNYSYNLKFNSVNIPVTNMSDGWYFVVFYVHKIGSGDGNTTINTNLYVPSFATVINGRMKSSIFGQVIAGRDLNTGSAGDFDGSYWIRYGYMKMTGEGAPTSRDIDVESN